MRGVDAVKKTTATTATEKAQQRAHDEPDIIRVVNYGATTDGAVLGRATLKTDGAAAGVTFNAPVVAVTDHTVVDEGSREVPVTQISLNHGRSCREIPKGNVELNVDLEGRAPKRSGGAKAHIARFSGSDRGPRGVVAAFAGPSCV